MATETLYFAADGSTVKISRSVLDGTSADNSKSMTTHSQDTGARDPIVRACSQAYEAGTSVGTVTVTAS